MILKEARGATFLLALLMGALPVVADTIPLTKDGNSVGWTADFPSGHSISITVEDLTDSNVTLSIHKTLLPPALGEEATVGITFTRTDFGPNTPSTFIISSETVRNETGFAWTGFHWELTPASQARFNPSASSWTVSPFTSVFEWGNVTDPNISLTVSGGGVVPNDSNFTPSGSLVIDTGPTGAFFVFKQRAIPEPATAAVVLVGGAVVALVKRRRFR